METTQNTFQTENGCLIFGAPLTGVRLEDARRRRLEVTLHEDVVHFHHYDGFNFLPTEIYYGVRKTPLKGSFETFWAQKVVPAIKACGSEKEILALFSDSPHWNLEKYSRNFYEPDPLEGFLGVSRGSQGVARGTVR